jgi:hypothetical protein
MNSIKCKNCGLKNFASEAECRRCGYSFLAPSKTKKEKTPRRFGISTLLMVGLLGGLAYYAFVGTEKSMEQINANDAKRVASQPAERPAVPGLSRSEYDRQKTMTYTQAVKNSASLSAHQQHVDQTEKAMQQISNSQPGK